MARRTNGTSQYLNSESNLSFAVNKAAVQLWLWWDSYAANDDDHALEYGSNGNTGGFRFTPNGSAVPGKWDIRVRDSSLSANTIAYIDRPTAGAWHHFVVNMDMSLASGEVPSVFVDGVSVPVTMLIDGNNTGNFPNDQLWLMTEDGAPSNFGAGRIAEPAIWSGINLVQEDVNSLYNGGTGAFATSVQGGSLAYYWKLCGTDSPELPRVGGINLTVVGATQVAHPIGTCGQAIAEDGVFFRRITRVRQITPP